MSLPQNPKALQTQLSASCVRPSARRSLQSSWVGSCAPATLQFRGPGPRGTESRADGAAVGLWAPPTPRQSCSRTGRAGSSSFSPGPRVRRAQRPATRSGLRRGVALRPPARTLRCWRPKPRARRPAPPPGYWGERHCHDPTPLAERERTAVPCLSLPGLGDQQAVTLRGFGCTTRAASGRREAVPRFATVSSSPAPTHPPRTLPPAGSLT